MSITFTVFLTTSLVLMSGMALPLRIAEHALAGARRHQAVKLGIFGETVDKRHQRRAVLDQPAACVGVGDIAHLFVGDVQKLRELGTVGERLIEHDYELGVGEHRARLHGIQQVFHILRDGSGI